MQFSKTTVPPITQLELFCHSLKSMKMNFSVFPGQSGLNIIETLWSLFETRMRNRLPPLITLKKLEDVLEEVWYNIPIETVQNLYESIPIRTAAVLKAEGGRTP
jgi:hypothetical protein